MELKKRLSILLYAESAFPFTVGGIAHLSYFLSRELAKKGHHVEIIFKISPRISLENVRRYLDENKYKNLELTPIKSIPLNIDYPIKAAILKTIKLFFKQINPLISRNYDIVHFITTGLSELYFLYPLFAKLRGKKTVLSCHDYNLIGLKNFLKGGPFYNITEGTSTKLFKILIYLSILVFKASWKFYNAKIIYSRTLIERITKEKLSDENVTFIPNGIDLNLYKGISKMVLEGNPSILFIGLYSKIKGADIALKAFKTIEKYIPEAKMYLIGGKSDVDVPKLIKRLKIKNVKDFGILSHEKTLSYIKGADLCLFPYRTKSFGITLLEALVAEKPVIAPNTGEFKELIKDNINGILTSLDPDEIAKRVVSLWENEEVRSRISSNTKEIVKKYGWSSIADEYVRCYRQILNPTEKQ